MSFREVPERSHESGNVEDLAKKMSGQGVGAGEKPKKREQFLKHPLCLNPWSRRAAAPGLSPHAASGFRGVMTCHHGCCRPPSCGRGFRGSALRGFEGLGRGGLGFRVKRFEGAGFAFRVLKAWGFRKVLRIPGFGSSGPPRSSLGRSGVES